MGKPSASFLRSDLPSKADRKFEKKLQFYSKVRDAVASLSATKSIAKKKKLRSRQKKLKVYDLSMLSESLPELKGPKQPPAAPKFKLNCKSRTELVINEARRLSEVLSNPNYQKDPLGYIYQHLQKTLPITEEIPKKNTNKDRGRKKKKKKKSKKNKASASGAPVSMDV